MTNTPHEIMLLAGKSGGFIVYFDGGIGRPEFAGSLEDCLAFIRQTYP